MTSRVIIFINVENGTSHFIPDNLLSQSQNYLEGIYYVFRHNFLGESPSEMAQTWRWIVTAEQVAEI